MKEAAPPVTSSFQARIEIDEHQASAKAARDSAQALKDQIDAVEKAVNDLMVRRSPQMPADSCERSRSLATCRRSRPRGPRPVGALWRRSTVRSSETLLSTRTPPPLSAPSGLIRTCQGFREQTAAQLSLSEGGKRSRAEAQRAF